MLISDNIGSAFERSIMCFSPAVSFSASLALGVVGIATLKKATRREEKLFALIPLLFATQQFIEGMLWLVLLQTDSFAAQYWLTQSYAVFAGMIWPVVVPLSLWRVETSLACKKQMLVITAVGAGIALYTFNALIEVGFTSRIVEYCILYEYQIPQGYLIQAAYVVATCGGFFCSSQQGVRVLGAANLIAFILAYCFYHYHLVSVWCFFAAIASGLIYWHFYQLRKSEYLATQAGPVVIG